MNEKSVIEESDVFENNLEFVNQVWAVGIEESTTEALIEAKERYNLIITHMVLEQSTVEDELAARGKGIK